MEILSLQQDLELHQQSIVPSNVIFAVEFFDSAIICNVMTLFLLAQYLQ